MNHIIVHDDQAKIYGPPKAIPTGQVRFSKILFDFSSNWDGMTKVAQFVQEGNKYNVDIVDNECICPSELKEGWVTVYIRGYLQDSVIATANGVVLPVSKGFEDGGTPSVPPTPDLYQTLLSTIEGQIGDLSELTTEDKDNLVSAINEVLSMGGNLDHSRLKNRYLADQHSIASITGLTDALDSKQVAINANTAARHSHANKAVLDSITAENTAAWNAKADKAAATQKSDGLMSAADKVKLDSLSGAGVTLTPMTPSEMQAIWDAN